MSKGFKEEMMNSLGQGIRCSTSCVLNQRITTFALVNDQSLSKRSVQSSDNRNNVKSPLKVNASNVQPVKKESNWGI